MTKKLMLVPIIHGEKEMGSLKGDISEMIDRKFGKERRDQHRKDVALFWKNLRTIMDAVIHSVDCSNIRIYQDGIPIGGDIGIKLIKMGAEDGIPNHQIVLSMIERGGIVEKTENPALLKEEYEILKAIVNAKTDQEREAFSEKYKKRLYDLTIERDRYIAHRISESLGDGMLGILFIGATHDVARYLAPDIELFVCNFVEQDVLAWAKGGNTGPARVPVENR
ncbi:MAG: hypothetical protein LUQ31_02990 [Methanoregula sp.]|nr:hypothetical protein [Methanoregula sp.]